MITQSDRHEIAFFCHNKVIPKESFVKNHLAICFLHFGVSSKHLVDWHVKDCLEDMWACRHVVGYFRKKWAPLPHTKIWNKTFLQEICFGCSVLKSWITSSWLVHCLSCLGGASSIVNMRRIMHQTEKQMLAGTAVLPCAFTLQTSSSIQTPNILWTHTRPPSGGEDAPQEQIVLSAKG